MATLEELLGRDRVLQPSWGPRIPTVWVNSGHSLLSLADAHCGHTAQALAGAQTGACQLDTGRGLLGSNIAILCILSGSSLCL